MIVSDAAIDRRTTVFVLLLLIVVAGGYSYLALPRESSPEVVIPLVLVTTSYEGVSPEDMESLVTVPIERELNGISGLKQIESTSGEGISFIQVEFEADENIDTALQKVRDKVDQAQSDIPEEAEDSLVREINLSEVPIMYLSLTGDVGLSLLTMFADDFEDELEAIPGVLQVEVVGGVEREIQIVVDPNRATEYGVSLADLVTLARVENVNTPAGSMELGDARFSVRVPGEFKSADEINNLAVKAGPDGIVYMRDIATVVDGFKEIESVSRINGHEAVTLTVSKRSGENIIEISEAVHAAVDRFEKRLLPGMQLLVTLDQATDVRDMVSELQNSILTGLILVLVVIFMFLGPLNAVMVALAIPVSLFITYAGLYASGTTLNMVVLFSSILALGMLVDNGIVVVENIFRHVQEGKSSIEAAKMGASEVAWPIIASTLTTIGAFAPMFFWPGIWGSFMFYLPQTVSLALGGSLFVGLIVNPALASVFMKFRERKTGRRERKRHIIIKLYLRLLGLALRWRAVTMVLSFALLIIITAEFFTTAHIEFTPNTEPRRAYIDVDCAEGTRLEFTDHIVQQLEDIVAPYLPQLDYVIANVGSRGVNQFSFGGGGNSHIGRVTLDFVKLADAQTPPSKIIEQVRRQLGGITGAEVRIEQEQEGPPEEPPVNVELRGDSFEVLAVLAERVKDAIRGTSNLVDLRDDYEPGKPEIRVNVDRESALLTGLNTDFVGKAVLTAIKGRKAGEYREGDEEYDVTVKFPDPFRKDLGNLSSMVLVNLNGQAIPFSAVAEVEQGSGFGSIKRIDRNRTVTVSADTDGQRSGAEVLADVRETLKSFPMPDGYSMIFTGENEDAEEAQTFIMQAFVVALFLIALVLITQFNSILQPLIIMTSVILSLAGVFFGLYILDMPFSTIMTGIGCISLAGVVVNNAIVLIDFVNQQRKAGMPVDEAIVSAGEIRFRPVMLTAITTILGLIPMALGVSYDFWNWKWIVGGESSQWWGPMAVAVIFGLAFATLLTLVVVPTLYSLFFSISKRVGTVHE